MKNFWFICVISVSLTVQNGHAQYYPLPVASPPNQNATVLPYPYQTPEGFNPVSDIGGTPNLQIQSGQAPYPYPLNFPYFGTPSLQGRPPYPYPGMMYPGNPLYPQPYGFPGFGYPQAGFGYAQTGGQYGRGFGQPSGFGYSYQMPKEIASDPTGNNIKTEIVDVSPEYQRQILGWPAEKPSSFRQGSSNLPSRPRYTVDVDTKTTNNTFVPANLTKPIITEKRFLTSIRRSFVYDSSKPESIKPINIHIINGQQVTTTAPPETTENENVQGLTTSSVKPSGRRFMDVPKFCPKGTMLAHNGECIEPFARNPKNSTYIREEQEAF